MCRTSCDDLSPLPFSLFLSVIHPQPQYQTKPNSHFPMDWQPIRPNHLNFFQHGCQETRWECSGKWPALLFFTLNGLQTKKDEMTEKTRAQSVMNDFHRHIWLGLCTACELWERPFQLIHAKSRWASGGGQDGRHSCLSQQLVSWFFLNHTWLYAKSGEGPIKTGIKISANFC